MNQIKDPHEYRESLLSRLRKLLTLVNEFSSLDSKLKRLTPHLPQRPSEPNKPTKDSPKLGELRKMISINKGYYLGASLVWLFEILLIVGFVIMFIFGSYITAQNGSSMISSLSYICLVLGIVMGIIIKVKKLPTLARYFADVKENERREQYNQKTKKENQRVLEEAEALYKKQIEKYEQEMLQFEDAMKQYEIEVENQTELCEQERKKLGEEQLDASKKITSFVEEMNKDGYPFDISYIGALAEIIGHIRAGECDTADEAYEMHQENKRLLQMKLEEEAKTEVEKRMEKWEEKRKADRERNREIAREKEQRERSREEERRRKDEEDRRRRDEEYRQKEKVRQAKYNCYHCKHYDTCTVKGRIDCPMYVFKL